MRRPRRVAALDPFGIHSPRAATVRSSWKVTAESMAWRFQHGLIRALRAHQLHPHTVVNQLVES